MSANSTEIVSDIASAKCTASIFPSDSPLPSDFVSGIRGLEAALSMPVWVLIQNRSDMRGILGPYVYKSFFDQRNQLPDGEPIALLIDSGGGDSACAYKLAKLLNKRCGSFVALVPSFAKSAATLLALGSDKIILGTYAELGPLDMQVEDDDGEARLSALNYVQTLERLGAYSLRNFDEIVMLFIRRTKKKVNNILPHAIDFTSNIVRPLMENVDVLKYTEMSRILKIGEDYAQRLLERKYSQSKAQEIASALVSNYPEHGFVIDSEEAEKIGLTVELPTEGVADAFAKLLPFVDELTVLGRLEEIKS